MGTILKQLGTRVYEDIVKEEIEMIKKFEEKDVRKNIGKLLPVIIKSIIKENQAA
ncbi:MAG: hypothetical protein ACQEXX_01285 [Bacillota bacterium]